MRTDNIAAARTWLQSRNLHQFIGVTECEWLDAKGAPYRLNDVAGAAELVKDVAAMANAAGGLLLVGFATRVENGREVIDELRPVPEAMVDTDRYRKLLRERVQPHVRGLRVDWIPVADGKGVVVIDVPTQAERDKPFVVPGPEEGKAFPNVGVPIRDADATRWLPRHELQRLLAAGWNATGGPSEDVVRALREAVISAVPAPVEPAPRLIGVGEGEGGMRSEFAAAYTAAGGAPVLGHPQNTVTRVGPGYFQPLDGSGSAPQAVLCALPERPCAVMPLEIWENLGRVGGGADRNAGVSAAGLPITPADDTQPLLVYASATAIELAGGSWGPGRFSRTSPGAPWLWQPIPRLDFNLWHNTRWPGGPGTDLRVRAVVDLAWLPSVVQPQLTKARRSSLQAALTAAEIANVFAVLSMRRGGQIGTPSWQPATGQDSYHSHRRTHLRATIVAPDNRPALIGEVIVQLPDNGYSTSVLGCVELQVNLDAWRATLIAAGADLADQPDLRLSVHEIIEVLTSAWGTVANVLPRFVVDAPELMPAAAAPYVEMHVRTGSPVVNEPSQHLGSADVVDLSLLGPPTRDVI